MGLTWLASADLALCFASLPVLNSPNGAEHGGTLFCQPKVWNDPTFPRHLFHQGRSKLQGIPAHTKQIIALHSPAEPGGKHHGYVVQGSHNFTPAAWGNLQHPRGPQSEPLSLFMCEIGQARGC